jgi:di/tricarboxylate transporter
MTLDQIALFALFAAVLGLLLWGRVRYDLVAVGGLLLAVLLDLVPEDRAFSGFSNPAVLIVAMVLVASRAFENCGVVALVTARLLRKERSLTAHIALTGGAGAALSAVINNVAALALLMPVDIQAARKAGRSPSLTLMALAFATILGGMVTLIGTPPNIIASTFRARELGAPYQMLDFAPVGLVVAVAGLAFIALAGWRLMPRDGGAAGNPVGADEFVADLAVPEGAAAIGKLIAELETAAADADVVVLGLIRDGKRLRARARYTPIDAGDVLAVEGATDGIAAFIKALGLHPRQGDGEKLRGAAAREAPEDAKEGRGAATLAVVEAVVRADARIAGRSAEAVKLRSRFGVTLLGIAHQGQTIRQRVRSRRVEPGDVLLLTGPGAAIGHAVNWLGAMPIDQVSVAPVRPWRIVLTVGCFIAAIGAAGLGLLSFATALAVAVTVYAVVGLVPLRELYDQVEWPVIVMLACLLPLGEAFETVGGTGLMADLILVLAHGQSAVVALVLLMVATMALSGVLNNVATMVIAGPLALAMASRLDANPDSFLMGAAVATSCAFLTPIGHKNNTLIMGPGGYAFADYLRMGLPLTLLVLAVGVPAILVVWPL